MKAQRLAALGFILVLFVTAALAAARELTVKDVVDLKKMNFSDNDIIAEIVKTDSKFNLSSDDIDALKAAKAGETLIRAMQNPPRKVSVEDISKMLADGKGELEILDAIAASPQKPKASIGEVRDLKENKAANSVLLAVRSTPLSVGDLQALAEGGAKTAVYDRLVTILGLEDRPVSLADAKMLMDAGVPNEIVARAKEAGAGKAVERPEREKPGANDAVPPKAPQPPVDDLHPAEFLGTWTGSSIGVMGDNNATTLLLRADGSYTLRVGAVGQGGKWHVQADAGTFSMQPSPGSPESHPYTLDETKTRLVIEGATGKMVLDKR